MNHGEGRVREVSTLFVIWAFFGLGLLLGLDRLDCVATSCVSRKSLQQLQVQHSGSKSKSSHVKSRSRSIGQAQQRTA